MATLTEKEGLETGALNQFAEVFASMFGDGRFVFRELRSPPEPDGLCSLDAEPLYVEVGHVYGTDTDAKIVLGREGKSAPTDAQQMESSLIPLDERLFSSLNDLLASKAKKQYKGDRVWLLIRCGLPFRPLQEFQKRQSQIIVPDTHPFEQIWLLCGPRAFFGALRLA